MGHVPLLIVAVHPDNFDAVFFGVLADHLDLFIDLLRRRVVPHVHQGYKVGSCAVVIGCPCVPVTPRTVAFSDLASPLALSAFPCSGLLFIVPGLRPL